MTAHALSVALVLALSLAPQPLRAEAGQAASVKNIQVAMHTLGFLTPPPSGPVDLAVLFDPAEPESVADLKTISEALERTPRAGAVPVRAVPLAVAELNRLAAFHFVLLTGGLRAYFPAVAEMARGRGVLTISTDLSCVRADQCVMGVAVEPRVQVLVSRRACEAAAVNFATSFRMMITEL